MSKIRFTLGLFTVTLLTLSFGACKKETQTPGTAARATSLSPVVVDSVPSEDGDMIYYDVRGQGDRALVFVHCWSCDRTYWRNQVDEFAREYRVVTVDLGGHGQSGVSRKKWTMADFGADVAAVVNKLDLQNVILIGHSMGGPVIIEAARRLPGRVVALVGIDNFQDLGKAYTPDQVKTYLSQFQPQFKKISDRFVKSMFPPTADTALVDRIADDMSSAPPEIALSALSETLLYDYRAALADVRLPIRTISSDKYPTFVDANNKIAASFAVKIIPGSGHFPHLENPETFNRLLHETIEEFWPGSSTR